MTSKRLPPPVARRELHTSTLHGRERRDFYDWMRRRPDEGVAYLDEEDAFANQWMSESPLYEQIEREIRGRIVADYETVPYRDGDYWYFYRYRGGHDYEIFCRSSHESGKDPDVLLDVNALPGADSYVDVADIQVSPDNSLLAYAVDTSGDEAYSIVVVELGRADAGQTVIRQCSPDFAWSSDSRSLIYVRLADEKRNASQVYRHELNSERDDVQLYAEEDESFWIYLTKSKSKDYILFNVWKTGCSEVWCIDATGSDGFQPACFHTRSPGHEYSLDHFRERWFIRTNRQTEDFSLMTALGPAEPADWTPLVPASENVYLDSFEIIDNWVATIECGNATSRLRLHAIDGGGSHLVPFDEEIFELAFGANLDVDSRRLRFVYSSLTTPPTTFDLDVNTRERELKRQQFVSDTFDSADYVSQRHWATAKDGTRIPISLVQRRDRATDYPGPLLLSGYGAEAARMEVEFDVGRLSLLDRGFAYAVAHVRGGTEMGRDWYAQTKQEGKLKTFDDFIACGEYLIEHNFTSASQLCVEGASAGGTLAAVVATKRPKLFRAVAAIAPFVDVVNTMADPTLPWVVEQHDEWGDPNASESMFEHMLSYSPYDQVADQEYPQLLVTASPADPNVMFWEPTKWVARMRHERSDKRLILLRRSKSHQGASGRYQRASEDAFVYAFFLRTLGQEGSG